MFTCSWGGCTSSFVRRSTLNRHVRNVHENIRSYVCTKPKCDGTFCTASDLKRHKMAVHDKRRVYVCTKPECDSGFSTARDLKRHKMAVHDKRRIYVCTKPECDSAFFSAHDLKRHEMAVHDKRRDYMCTKPECYSAFFTARDLKRHEMAVHEKRRDHVCTKQECDNAFSTVRELKRHEMAVHDKIRNYVCTKLECDSAFFTVRDLKRHEMAVHDKRRDYVCSKLECDSAFFTARDLKRHEMAVHEKRRDYVCTKLKCYSAFFTARELKRHEMAVHDKIRHYVCTTPECNSAFFTAHDLKRHEVAVHEKRRDYKCDQCKKTFAIYDNYYRHKRDVHGVCKKRLCNIIEIGKPTFICAECGVKYNRKDNLVQHITNQHGVDEYECHHCGFNVKAKVKLRKHILARHFSKKNCIPMKKSFFKCVLCEISYQYLNQLNKHYVDVHDVKLKVETLSFSSMEEFSNWRNKLEDSTITRFRLRRKFKNTYRYICHRSGLYNNRSTGKRVMFCRGSKKLDGFCPASITLKLNKNNSSYTAAFISTHVGHAQNDTKELKFIFCRKEERENLAKRIASGVSLRHILDEEVLHQSPNDITRRALNSKDLYNLQASFNIKATENFVRLRENDLKNIEEFIYEYKYSILLYKRQGESGPEKFSDCQLNNNDIILVFMSPSQKNLLKKYGNEIVCLDGTHGLNPNGFILHILLVLDCDGEAIPVAFLLSNRDDKMMIKVFLRCIREKTCEITSPLTLMTDSQESYYNAWVEEMDKPQSHLYCLWHVWHAWKTRLPKKNEQLKQDLCDLTVEKYPNTFQAKLEKILSPSADNEVNAFLKYFKEQYCDNNKWIHWSYAYRMHCGMNTIMHLEAFHDTMKYFFSRVKMVKDLYSGLKFIVRYVRRKMYDLSVKLIYGNIPIKLNALRKAHKKVEAKGNIFIQKIGEEWLVPSFKGPKDGCEELYTVCISRDTCPAEEDKNISICPLICKKCDVCAHKYICSCIENSIRSHMCKHIHAVVLFERTFLYSIESSPTHNRNVSCSSSITEFVEFDESTQQFSNNDAQEDERRERLEKRFAELMET